MTENEFIKDLVSFAKATGTFQHEANKIPVTATDVDGLKQVVEGDVLLFPMRDYMHLADHVNNLLRDKYYYQSIVDKCYERAKMYDISLMADKYIQVYSEL